MAEFSSSVDLIWSLSCTFPGLEMNTPFVIAIVSFSSLWVDDEKVAFRA